MNYLQILSDSLLILTSKYISNNCRDGCHTCNNILDICEICNFSNKYKRGMLASFCLHPQQILFMDCYIINERIGYDEQIKYLNKVGFGMYTYFYYCWIHYGNRITCGFNHEYSNIEFTICNKHYIIKN